MKTAVVYYSDKSISPQLKNTCLSQLLSVVPPEVELIMINQAARADRNLISLFLNILCGISQTEGDYIYLAEHDVLYPQGYFMPITDWQGQDFTFTQPGYFLNESGYYKRTGLPLSSLMGKREAMVKFCEMKLLTLLLKGQVRSCEPTPAQWHIKIRRIENPFIDIRHSSNFTGNRHGKTIMQEIEYWPKAASIWKQIKGTV